MKIFPGQALPVRAVLEIVQQHPAVLTDCEAAG